MSHYARIPKLLDALLITPSIAAACRAVGITQACFYGWLIRSKAGDAPLQAIEWMGVTTDFGTHYQNSKVLAAQAIEAGVLDQAMRGTWRETRFQGQVVYELSDSYAAIGFKSDAEAEALGFVPERDKYVWEKGSDGRQRRKRVMEWSKSSDAMSTLVLQSWARRRYGQHATVDIQHGGVLRLERADERTATKVVEAPITFDDDDAQVEQRGGHLALGRPAKDSAELDAWAAAGEFQAAPVGFVDAAGNRVERIAAPDPLLPQETDTSLQRDLKARVAARGATPPQPAPPTMVSQPDPDFDLDDQAPPRPAPPQPRDEWRDGDGRVAPGGMRVV
jgi:hypothetical protein